MMEENEMKKTTRMVVVIGMIVVLALSVFALTGCGKSGGGESEKTDWEYIQDRGKVIVGLDDTFAPMGFRDENNEIVGFDIDLAKAVFEEMPLEEHMQQYLDQGLSQKEAMRRVAADRGLSRRDIYQRLKVK
jgi:ABC-type amino acid transport substrate-binding protein